MGELFREKTLWAASAVCCLAIAAGILFSNIKLPLAAGSFIKLYEASLRSQAVLFLIPIASVLSQGAVYVKEISNGFIKFYIMRISRMDYIKRKTVLIYAGGFFSFFFAGIFVFLLAFFCLYPLEVKGAMDWEGLKKAAFCLLRICLAGGLLSEISGVFSVLFRNYYMAYGLPFVCYYFLIILKERYLPGMYAMDPAEWIAAESNWGTNGWGIWAFFFLFSAVAACLHGLLLYVRLKEI